MQLVVQPIKHTTPLLKIKPNRERELVVVLENFIVVLCRFISCAHGDTWDLFKRLNFFASWFSTRHVQIRHTKQNKHNKMSTASHSRSLLSEIVTFLVFNSQFTDTQNNFIHQTQPRTNL